MCETGCNALQVWALETYQHFAGAGEVEAQGDGRLPVQQCRQEVWAADWGPAGNLWKEEGRQD